MIAVSKCLSGVPCRYDGATKENAEISMLVKDGQALCICPEYLLSVPREPCEIVGGDGADVLCGKAKVLDKNGNDRTEAFVKGAEDMLQYLRENGITKVILKAKSPSCGFKEIYDGTFSGRCKPGNGVAAALFLQHGIEIEAR